MRDLLAVGVEAMSAVVQPCEEDSHILGKVGALLIGVGVGVGVGLLIAPARGEKTRADIAEKVSDFGAKVRERTGKKSQTATATYGE